jgi:hypothetical protein
MSERKIKRKKKQEMGKSASLHLASFVKTTGNFVQLVNELSALDSRSGIYRHRWIGAPRA